jgi:Entner-Doudoroff aldolase
MTPDAFVSRLWEQRISAILRVSDQQVAAEAMGAAVRGGFRIVEFTLTIPGAFELIADFARREDLVVGAGTVMTPAQATAAVRAGARFLVSPVVDEEVIAAAHVLGVAVMPGTHTPTEMTRAHRAGAQLQKLFPAPADGPTYVRSCRGPLPFLRIVPTNGVDSTNLGAWLDAGAWAAGVLRAIFDPDDLAQGRYDRIEARARTMRAAAAAVDRGKPPTFEDPFA